MSVRDRIYERKFRALIRTFATYRRVRIVHWCAHKHHLYIGTDTMHRTPAARKMNCIKRMRINRE